MYWVRMMFAHNSYLEGNPQIPRSGMCQTCDAFRQSEDILHLAQTPLGQHTPLQALPEHENYVL